MDDSKQEILLYSAIFMIIAFSVVIIFGDNGLADLNILSKKKKRIIRKNTILVQENLALYRAVDRIKNDPEYVENIARQELGVIKKNEMIFKLASETETIKTAAVSGQQPFKEMKIKGDNE